MMKKLIFAVVLIAGLFIGNVVYANSAHFVKSSAVVNNAGSLVVNFKETGVDGEERMTYKITADACATYISVNNEGAPETGDKITLEGPVEKDTRISSDKKGRVIGRVQIDPKEPETVSPGQNMVLAEVSYSNIQIQDIKYGLFEPVPGLVSKVLPIYLFDF